MFIRVMFSIACYFMTNIAGLILLARSIGLSGLF